MRDGHASARDGQGAHGSHEVAQPAGRDMPGHKHGRDAPGLKGRIVEGRTETVGDRSANHAIQFVREEHESLAGLRVPEHIKQKNAGPQSGKSPVAIRPIPLVRRLIRVFPLRKSESVACGGMGWFPIALHD